jgi:hypothetical protein
LLEPDEKARQAVAELHALAQAAVRDPTSIGIEGAVFIAGKTPEDWQREALGWQALGATHLSVNTSHIPHFESALLGITATPGGTAVCGSRR